MHSAQNLGYEVLKRTADICAAVLGILLTLPIQIVVAALVMLKLGRPILFTQVRPGRDAEPFTLIKFRSMKEIRDVNGPDSDEKRLTSFGKRLRSTSIDELPSLWNVLRGDMSLVGPRPLLMDYLPRYTPEQARRHEVRPGLTGLAQVEGRNSLTWEQKFALDVYYVNNRSVSFDLRILWRTVSVVIFRRGINNQGHATMPEFESKGEAREK